MKKSPLRKRSAKQQQRIDEWGVVCLERRAEQIEERGYVWCERCMLPERTMMGYNVWGHHKTPRSQGGKDVKENCELNHWVCHVNTHHGGNLYYET